MNTADPTPIANLTANVTGNPTGCDTADGSLAALAQRFQHFADTECHQEPVYEALCRLLAQRPQALQWLLAAPPPQQRPNLLLAALHQCVQQGRAPALAAYCRSAGGSRPVDAGLPDALDRTLAEQAPALQHLCATRSTQTNEVGRSAVLWPALAELARGGDGRPLALLDFGCSAGLNLGLDHFHYRYRELSADAAAAPWTAGAPPQAGGVQLDCLCLGPGVPTGAVRADAPARQAPVATDAPGGWRVAGRHGLDPAPVPPHDVAGLQWLRACLWPSDTLRLARFDAAVALARRERFQLQRLGDGLADIHAWLQRLGPDVQPVLMNTWVLTYLQRDELQRHLHGVQALVRERGLAWVSGEGPWLKLGSQQPAALDLAALPDHAGKPGPQELAQGTRWWLWRPGAAQPELLARSHAHGRWLQWLG